MIDEVFAANSAQTGNPLLLTISQVADLLNLGRTKTYELVMSGRIRSVKVGRRRLVVWECQVNLAPSCALHLAPPRSEWQLLI